MTTRVAALTVILEGEPREDDIEDLVTAIRRLRGVADVQMVELTGDMRIAEIRSTLKMQQQVYAALREIFDLQPR